MRVQGSTLSGPWPLQNLDQSPAQRSQRSPFRRPLSCAPGSIAWCTCSRALGSLRVGLIKGGGQGLVVQNAQVHLLLAQLLAGKSTWMSNLCTQLYSLQFSVSYSKNRQPASVARKWGSNSTQEVVQCIFATVKQRARKRKTTKEDNTVDDKKQHSEKTCTNASPFNFRASLHLHKPPGKIHTCQVITDTF